MSPWSFHTADYPRDERRERWINALTQLCLPVGELSNLEVEEGRVTCQTSPLGIEFSLLESASMTFSGSFRDQPEGIWLSTVIEGDGELIHDDQKCTIRNGDIIYGPTGVEATLSFDGPFRQLYVRAPKLALNPRVLVPMSLPLGLLDGSRGIQHVFSHTLCAVGETLPELKPYQLRPIELAVTEFLLTSLEGEKAAFGLGGAKGIKVNHFHQICQAIESVLSEPDLSLKTVAELSGSSPRYVQKLFASAGTSVSKYIRTRRLERCRQDLSSPIHSQLSISDICFRWGFNGTAHFSRIFRKEYGETPSEFRRSMNIEIEEED
ncbi:MAG: helix-turn-helix domain-containing protein [Pseudomonadota bacterium]